MILNMERFIPAGAGNTRLFSGLSVIKTVYPAGAGTLNSAAAAFNSVRFIPLAREHQKHTWRQAFFPVYPAGAGNTLHYTQETPQTAVYPAGAGNTLQDDVRGLFNRFIPLARGTR
ncbi:hypothetical protein IVZ55_21555 [Salmonella enterica subsp. enterica serovar Worthington]|nr:hypothetical protein [Salmonella enterica subsp. enterica serovar Worthington]